MTKASVSEVALQKVRRFCRGRVPVEARTFDHGFDHVRGLERLPETEPDQPGRLR